MKQENKRTWNEEWDSKNKCSGSEAGYADTSTEGDESKELRE